MKNLIGNLLLLFFSFALVFAIGEVASRVFSPISPGPSILDSNGNKQKISYIEPGKTFRITTPDYDAQTSITQDGYRAPRANGNPETIFIGDSFTYAQGVTDQQAFPAIYCKTKGIQCANLAVPGASTLYETDRLEHYLRTKNWSPNYVNLFFFTGNDFTDNLAASANRREGIAYEPEEISPQVQEQKSLWQRIIETGLHYSNLLRVAYYKVLPVFRDNPQQSEDALNDALKITRTELLRLNALSEKYAFALRIFIVFPQQEIEQGIYKKLTEKIQSISPVPVIPLGELFKENTARYYFPTDGHFNVAGNRKLADYLLQKHY
jgi:hypothetical protein